MFALNIDPNNPKGNPEAAELGDLGVEWVRYTFYDSSDGDQLDPGQAQFYRQKAEDYHSAGIGSLVILTYDTYPNRPPFNAGDADWDRYIERFARRAGQIAQLLGPWRAAFQVWNEPDHPDTPDYSPTLRENVFGRMLRRTYDAIKAVDPGFPVITAGLAAGDPSWLSRVIQSQDGTLPADILAFHPYGQRPDPDWPHPNWAFGYVGDLLNRYYRAGQRKPVWITEMGVKEEDLDHNRETVAEFLTRYYRAMTTRYSDKVEQLFWFCYSDGMVPTFGLVDGGGNRKPAYRAFREAATRVPAPPPEPAITTLPPTQPEIPVSPLPEQPAAAPDLARLAGQISGLQGQLAQLQRDLAQLRAQIQQWRSGAANGFEPSAGAAPPPAEAPAVGMPPIEDIRGQLSRHPTLRFPTRPQEQIRRIIIHHTAIPPSVGARRIADHRVNTQGWPGIGYHFFITGDGRVQQTNELTTVSTHAGQYDPVSVGVCFAGDFTEAIPTPAQLEAGARLIAWLLAQLGLPLEAVSGYKELANTQSPGQQWDSGLRWGQQLKARIQAVLQTASG
ncbi:MAG: N-acetylmuramoyl-L-alanine amidase [Anaerolineae bacterium]